VIITEPEQDDELVVLLTAAGVPLVTVGDAPGQRLEPGRVIDIDAARLTRVALDHLASAGARRIAMVNGTDRNEWCLTSADCYRGWTAERGRPAAAVEIALDRGDAGGRTAVDELVAAARQGGAEPPDGYYCLTAAQALGVCARLRELGLRVPEDVRVVAGSDSERCRTASPTITAVDLEPEVLGRRAVATMLAILGSEELPVHPARVGRLVVRGTTAPTG
jgi:DNA-binding LacI/PurR family transcriptional regulator